MSSIVDEVRDTFPIGLRILAIDDDVSCLMCVERMLQACGYQVTKCQTAVEALSLLRGQKDKFDIVLSDVHMPDMDGLRLLEIIRAEMDLPVVMMSIDYANDIVKRVIVQGASDYLVKPIRLENVRVIWQHVVRKQRNNLKPLDTSNVIMDYSYSELHQNKPRADQANVNAICGDKENCGSSNRDKDEEDEVFKDEIGSVKKRRMIWTTELHEQFVKVVNQIGLKNAVPKRILELMNVSGLTRENVASHLQKYRQYLRKNNENLQKKLSMTTLQLQDLSTQSNDTYAISNPLQQSYSISQIANGTPNDFRASNALGDLGDLRGYYNYGTTDLMLRMEQQSFTINEMPTTIESEQDCSTTIQNSCQTFHPLAVLTSNLIDGYVTEMFDGELFPLDQHQLHQDVASRFYVEHYGGKI